MAIRRGELCEGCPHLKQTMSFASTRGEMDHGVMIVLEALGEQEAYQQVPAVGPTGSLLNRMIERTIDPETGKLFKRDEFLVTNTVWCRPFEFISGRAMNRAPTPQEMEYCMKLHLLPLIEKMKPKAILAAGAVPFQALTGREEGIGKLRGYSIPMAGTNIPVVGTYHPAYLLKGKLSLIRVWQMDFLKATYLARKGPVPEVERSYLEDPPVAAWNGIVQLYLQELDKGERLSFDIETPYAGAMKDELIDPDELRVEDDESFNIFRIAFCVRPHRAVSVPWDPAYIPGIAALLAHPGEKIVWNRFFDVPRVEFNGCPVGGTVIDGMDMWHFTEPGFPMGLKYATTFVAPDMPPWVLEKDARPAWYNAADTDTARRCVDWCEARLRREGRWEIFDRHFTQLGQRLQKISLRGIPTDPVRRAEKRGYFEKLFEMEIEGLQKEIPDPLKPLGKPFKSSKEKLIEQGKWIEGKMVAVKVTRRETRDDIPEEERCSQKKCSSRATMFIHGPQRCAKHLLKKQKEAVEGFEKFHKIVTEGGD